MNQSKVVNRIEEICKKFDSRINEIGLLSARFELAHRLAECENHPSHKKAPPSNPYRLKPPIAG